MEASARKTGLRERTAEDNLDTKGLSRLRRGGGGSLDDPDSGPNAESDDSGEFDEALLEGLDINISQGDRKRAGVFGERMEEREALDSQFEAVREIFAGGFNYPLGLLEYYWFSTAF